MTLTEEQMVALAPYQKYFETAVKADWSRHPGSAALDLMNDIYSKVTGTKQKLNKGCSNCTLNLLRELGKIYLADLAEREEARKKVALKEATPEPVKVEVKVDKPKRKYTRKPKTNAV